MDILYEFNTVGIVYTAVVGGLIVLLCLSMFMFAAKRRPSSAGTVLYRVLDILLLLVLLAAWFVFIIGQTKLFGLSVKPDGEALAFASESKTFFSIPYIGGLIDIFDTVLGTILLGALSFVALLGLILSFALRRGVKDDTVTVVAEQEETLSAYAFDDETQTAKFEETPVSAPAAAPPVAEAETEVAANLAAPAAPLEPPAIPFADKTVLAAEMAEDVLEAVVVEDKADEVLVDVEVLDEEEVLEPVEILPEEPSFAAAAEEAEPRELSPAVKEAIKTVVIDTPQAVKDALRVVLGEDAFIVKEVLRVIVESPTETIETPAAEAVYEATDAPASEPVYETAASAPVETTTEAVGESVAASVETEPEQAAEEPVVVRSAAEDGEPLPEVPIRTEDRQEDESEGFGLIRKIRQPAHKTYSSSLRRPDMKKKNTAAVAKIS